MQPEEQKVLANIVMTLADPKGNWPFVWKQLCELANLDPEQYRPNFARHPVLDLSKQER